MSGFINVLIHDIDKVICNLSLEVLNLLFIFSLI